MHDDAITTFSANTDQTTMGHQFISNTFGPQFLPQVGVSLSNAQFDNKIVDDRSFWTLCSWSSSKSSGWNEISFRM
jgi:hypothetical protein